MTTQLKGAMVLNADGTNAAYFSGVRLTKVDRVSFAYSVDPAYAAAQHWDPSERVPIPATQNPQIRYQDNSEEGSPNVDLGVRPSLGGTYEAGAHEVQVVLSCESGEIPAESVGPDGTEITVICPKMPGQTGPALGCRLIIEP